MFRQGQPPAAAFRRGRLGEQESSDSKGKQKMHNTVATFQGNSINWALEKAQWYKQRNVGDPADEAEEGVDFAGDNSNPADSDEDDDQSVDEFLKVCIPPAAEEHDELSGHLHKCGLHLCKAKIAHMAGDHKQVGRSINSAMASYAKLHAGLKAATED